MLFTHRKNYSSVPMKNNNLKYDLYNQYTSSRPTVLKPVHLVQNQAKPIKFKKKKKMNFSVFLVFALIGVFVGSCVFPFSCKNFYSPLLKDSKMNSFNVNMENIFSPTSEYLHNDIFMGSKFLTGAEQKKPVMAELNLTDEMTQLESSLKSIAAEYPNVYPSVFVWDYDTGKYAALNADTPFPAASIIKIPVLLQLFRSMEAGQGTIDETMTLTDYYRAEGSGDLQFQKEGNEYSLDTLARKMIEISDNSSTNMLMSKVGGMYDVNRAIKSWGLQRTQINNWLPDMGGTNYTTTTDLARMLYNIENEAFLSKESKDKIFDYMGHVKNNRLIAAGLGANAKFIHKTGDIGYMLGDAGIVTTADGHKYIVTMMAKRPYNNPNGKDFIVRASQAIYNSISNRNLQ